MFKIVEEHPTRLEKEFKAVKEMAKRNREGNNFFELFFLVWILMLLFALFDLSLLTFWVAGSVVLIGLSLSSYFFVPPKYRILYKRQKK